VFSLLFLLVGVPASGRRGFGLFGPPRDAAPWPNAFTFADECFDDLVGQNFLLAFGHGATSIVMRVQGRSP
jgi:hypothetical protein